MKSTLYRIIFESDTKAGKWFDILLIFFIVLSVFTVMLDSVQSMRDAVGNAFNIIEWTVTLIFTIEFILRLYCSPSPKRYVKSFFGVIDILSILPTYISVIIPGAHFLMSVRVLRVLRVFRILKFVQYIEESRILLKSFKDSFRKIVLFISGILTVSVILGSIMYVIEGEVNGFTSIPKSVYWAIVTLTTVGYGDISPMTDLGKFVAGLIMVLGYSIIVVPTGFVSASYMKNTRPYICESCRRSQNLTYYQFSDHAKKSKVD
jgi:voltage-gated potassium channel